jgi:carbon monoxide dehydrogenase subunit G
MTVRVEQTIRVSAPPERVWEFIADPEKRARSISVVTDWEDRGDGTSTWFLRLPIPVINKTVTVETEDVERRPPEYVRFVGKSKAMRVQGEHELEPTEDGGTALHNRFVVDGRFPGVERFFKRNLGGEIDNLETALREDLGMEV